MTAQNKQPNKEEAKRLIELNPDAREYFFTKADENWLVWLLSNGFLEPIKQGAEDPTSYQYRMPELEYLVKVAPKKPKEVVDIMLSVDVPNNFNPEVVDRFLWICAHLDDAGQLARMVKKIRDEEWIQRMGGFRLWAFVYEKMFESLMAAGDQDSALVLADAVLAVRTREDLGKETRSKDQPFYFEDMSQSKVFEHLVTLDDGHAEAAFGLVTKTLGEIVLLGGEKEDDVFAIGEIFALFDIDFFTIEGGRENGYSPREEVKDLAATARKLAERLIGNRCGAVEEARRLHDTYVAPLPDARTMWRFRLFLWSLCPSVFKAELKNAFFRIFEVGDRVWPIAAGAEYERALQKGFGALSDGDQREYVRRALELFSPEEGMRLFGYDIVSSIFAYLTDEEKIKAKEIFGKELNSTHVPEPSIGRVYSGVIAPQVPRDSEQQWERPVPDIVVLLKTEWTPTALRALDTPRDFLRPISAEGIASRLREEIKKRLPEYLSSADLFFDRDALDPHYTYSFLRGVCDALAGRDTTSLEWGPLMTLFAAILSSARQRPFEHGRRDREEADVWLGGWDAAHNALADLVKALLGGDEEEIVPFNENRQGFLDVLSYLLGYPDPLPKEHEPPKKDSSGREEYTQSDPFTEAINSARGRSFQAFTIFVYRDGLRFGKEAPSKLSADVKKVYTELLSRENTEAIMFLIGHSIAVFYFRDKDWFRSQFVSIFPDQEVKKDLFIASAEGYLSSSLYTELFTECEFLYKRVISLTPQDYTPRRYFKDIDEGLATHFALAYMHFDGFDTTSNLLTRFWWSAVPQRREEFVSFIGRYAVSRENAKKWCEENKISIEKLKTLWDWVLNDRNHPQKEVLSKFGFWIDVEKDMFDPVWLADHTKRTLEKSQGVLDWEYGMMKSLPTFVTVAPSDSLAALKYYLEAMVAGAQSRRGWMYVDSELVDIVKQLYRSSDPTIKNGIRDLVNWLVRHGGTQFWALEQALKEIDSNQLHPSN